MKSKTEKNLLLKYLSPASVATSAELIERLIADGLSPQSARQALHRNADGRRVWRSEKLRLQQNGRLFARKELVGTSRFLASVLAQLQRTDRHGIRRCLEALQIQGSLHKVHAMKLLAVSPESNVLSPGKRSYEEELKGLQELGVRTVQQDTPCECLLVPSHGKAKTETTLITHAINSVRTDFILTRVLIDHLRRQNMIAWNQVGQPDFENLCTVFNGQVFSAHSYSFLHPLAHWNHERGKPTPCPVLIDSYHGLCTSSHTASFLQRVERAMLRGKSRGACLSVIAAADFEPRAFRDCRENGLLTISYRQLFGDQALEALSVVQELIGNLPTGSTNDRIESKFLDYAKILEELKSNPIVAILRSVGFEVLSGLVLCSLGYERVQLGKSVPYGLSTRDVDCYGFSGDELRVIECKAYHNKKPISEEEVSKFFTQTVPSLKKMLRGTDRHFSKCVAEIWNTGSGSSDTKELLSKLKIPPEDEWKIVEGHDIKQLLPSFIKERGSQLISTIAMDSRSDACPS